MKRSRKRLVGLLAMLTPIASCGAPTYEAPIEHCTRVCDGRALEATGCDAGLPRNAIKEAEVDPTLVSTLRGWLVLKRGDAKTICADIYWTEFTPDPKNEARYRVATVISAFPELDNPPSPQKIYGPREVGRTDGYGVGISVQVNACVIEVSVNKWFCLASVTGNATPGV